MKSAILFIMFTGCVSTPLTKTVPPTFTVPEDAHYVHCGNDVEDCFRGAELDCSPDRNNTHMQHQRPGRFIQVPEPGFYWPAIVQEESGWKIFISCQD
jgi:hypothetical protein